MINMMPVESVNSVYENNGYVRFIMNAVELLPNPRNGEKKNRNFSGELRVITGRDSSFKTEERFANFVVPRDLVGEFEKYDIDMWQASEPDEEGVYTRFSKVKLKFNEYTRIFLVEPNKKPVQLTEESVGVLDNIRIRNADIEVGRSGNPNRRGKYTLWVRTMYVYQDLPQDPFAAKFAEFDAPQADPLL